MELNIYLWPRLFIYSDIYQVNNSYDYLFIVWGLNHFPIQMTL